MVQVERVALASPSAIPLQQPVTERTPKRVSRYTTTKLTVQNISDCQYVAAMNPTAGSFQVNTSIRDTNTHHITRYFLLIL